MIIDSHSHWLPEEIITHAHFFSRAWGDIEAQIKAMGQAGINQAVLSYPTSDAHLKLGGLDEVARIYNDNVAKIILRYPEKFIGAAILPVDNPDKMQDEFKRVTEDLGFKAISLASSYEGMYLDGPRFLPIYKEAARLHIPIFVHAQIIKPIGTERIEDPLLTPVIEYVFDITITIGKMLMAGIFRDCVDTKFIFAYFGGAVCHLENRFDATYQMLRGINFVKDLGSLPTQQLKNIYIDTSGDKKPTNFQAALELLGAGHILWGSDWPAKKDVSGSIQAVKDLAISEDDKTAILGGNLERMLGLQ